MDYLTIESSLFGFVTLKPVNSNCYKVESNIKFQNGKKVDLYIKKDANKWFFADNKSTIKYMNELYELKSSDVKNCIASVLKVYNFSLIGGEICATIHNSSSASDVLCNLIMCIGQLSNMYAFFEKPE